MSEEKKSSNKNDSKSSGGNVGTKETKKDGGKDFDQPSKQIIDELNKAGSKKQMKIFSFSLNPIFIIVLSILVALITYVYAQRVQVSTQPITLGMFIENLKENRYSEVEIIDSGKANAVSKTFNVVNIEDYDLEDIEKVEGTQVITEDELTDISITELVTKLKEESTGVIVRSPFAQIGDTGNIKQIIISEDFIIAEVSSKDHDGYLVKDADRKTLEEEMATQNITFEDLTAEVTFLISAARVVDKEEGNQRFQDGFFSAVWIIDSKGIAELKPGKLPVQIIDFATLRTDFPQLLQNEGIELDSPEVNIYQTRERNFDYGLIVNIISMMVVVFLVVTVIRSLNGGGKGLMQFGQSKAKMFFGKKPEVTFKDVAGVDSAKDELNEVVLFLKDPKRFLKVGARIPKGLLMVGPPGTGKTLLARAIAGEAGVPFFHTSGSEFEEMLVGAGASRVRDLFGKAKKASPALIFIDEIDAVARKRGTTVQASTTEQTLNQILVEMDGFEKSVNVIVIAATNRPDVLDPAILRPGRFDRRIVVDLPDIKGRDEILQIHAKNKPLAKDVDLEKVARRTVGYTGADLENMINEAAIIVAKDNRSEITEHDIEEAANRTTMGRARKIQRTDDEIKKTAYHEAGHAIVAKRTPKSDPVHKITIVSRGMALGVTMQLPERDKYSQSYVEMESRLRVLMGGRAAEEIIYGAENITSGASNDIEKASDMARRMVKQYGYSDKLGLVKYGSSDEPQMGYGYGEQAASSPKFADMIDEEVKRIIDEAYAEALKILKENSEILEKISLDLLDKEVIDGKEFDSYFDKK